ncbi:MAG: insulinase family protein, partial [Acidobacteria bacterium]|nr:insulinase family protein [Acidobacteriota bacterium]
MRSTHRARRCVALVALVLGAAAAVAAPVDAAVRPTKFDYHITTLGNGLTVILSEDRSTPIVNLQMWYHVGSKDEPAGRTGFAHLFEHLMFKGSQNVRSDEHLSMISSVGGTGNAYTTEDVPVFFETVPAQYLPLVLWLEADRMATLRVSQRTLDSEREVVKEERRWRYENQPFGMLSEILYDEAFTT